MKPTLNLCAIVLHLCTILLLPSAVCADGEQQALQFLRKRHAEVRQILRRPAGTESQTARRNRQLKQALGDLLDFEELSKRALQDHWAGLSEKQRTEFVGLLSQLVERSYQRNLESTMDYRVRYEPAQRVDDSLLVPTRAQSLKNRRAPAIAIDYTLLPQGSAYRVYDITTEGVSLVANYRRQFNKIIRRDGWDALLDRMKKKLESDGDF